MFNDLFFNGWQPILRIIILTVTGYVALVLVLRASGKRTLSSMNMFDFIVTVAIGSMYATLVLSDNIALASAVAAFATIVIIQFIVTWLSVRSELMLKLVKARPKLLYYNGELLKEEMKSERIPLQELHYALRKAGHASFDGVRAVVLETDGQLSVVDSIEGDPENVAALTGVAPRENTANRQTPIA